MPIHDFSEVSRSGSHAPGGRAVGTDLRAEFARTLQVVPARTPELITQAQRIRYQAYCLDNRFEDPCQHPDGRERDALDGQALHSLLVHRPTGMAMGTVRLIFPGPQPLPARTLVPGDWPVPDPATGEISRFSISKPARALLADQPQLMSYITAGLMQAIVAMTAEAGLTHWVAAMEPTLLRLLSRLGIRFSPWGPIVEYHGRRQPCHAHAATLLQGIRHAAPEIWSIITDDGRLRAPVRRPILTLC